MAALALACSCGGSKSKQVDGPAPSADERSPEEKVVADLSALRWDKLGHPVFRWDAIPSVRSTKEKPHQLLLVLV